MRGIALVSAIFVLAACADEPEEPRDPKVPLPKTAPVAGVQIEPFNASEHVRPQVMHAVLRCKLDAEGRTRCELDVPRARAWRV